MLRNLQNELRQVKLLFTLTVNVIEATEPKLYSAAVDALRYKRLELYSAQIAELEAEITTYQLAQMFINTNMPVVYTNGHFYI